MLLLLLLFCYLCDDNVVVGAVDGKCVAVAESYQGIFVCRTEKIQFYAGDVMRFYQFSFMGLLLFILLLLLFLQLLLLLH